MSLLYRGNRRHSGISDISKDDDTVFLSSHNSKIHKKNSGMGLDMSNFYFSFAMIVKRG